MYSLRLSLFPSFIYALFVEVNGKFVKIAGWKKGYWITQVNGHIYGNCGSSELSYWSGLWFVKHILNSDNELVKLLFHTYHIGLSISPYDKELLFIPIFLSRTTSWEANVLRWCRKLWSMVDSLEDVLRVDITTIGRSFQLKQLKCGVKEFLDNVYPVMDEDPFTVRRALLSCKWVGPKIADAYLLSTGIDVTAVPIDTHMIKMARRLGIDGIAPIKKMCIRYDCTSCPLRTKCLRYLLNQKFDKLAGWVQTVFYLFEHDYCTAMRCSTCPIQKLCRSPYQLRNPQSQ